VGKATETGMQGKGRMLGAMEGSHAGEFPVVIPYLGIFLRGHWEQVTHVPWWAVRAGDIEASLQVARDLRSSLGID
jgi:hypothetical protein